MKTTEQKIKSEKQMAGEALKKLGYVKTEFAGWVYEDRLNRAMTLGYLKRERLKTSKINRVYSGFTNKTNDYYGVIKYLTSDADSLP